MQESRRRAGLVIGGTIPLLVGAFFFATTIGILSWEDQGRLWPVYLLIVGVAFFRAELVKLVPFVGLTGAVEPAIFAALVIGAGLLFWALSDGLVSLAAHVAAHAQAEAAYAERPVLPTPTVMARTDKMPGVGDVPGFQRYQRPLRRVMKWTANVTNGPAYLATAVCEVESGERVTAIGEVAEFAFVETPRGNGWLPKDSLAELAASA